MAIQLSSEVEKIEENLHSALSKKKFFKKFTAIVKKLISLFPVLIQ